MICAVCQQEITNETMYQLDGWTCKDCILGNDCILGGSGGGIMNNIADDTYAVFYDGLRYGQSRWIKTADRLPTEADAGLDEEVFTIYDDGDTRLLGTDYWAYVAMVPKRFPYWLPVPKLPEIKE